MPIKDKFYGLYDTGIKPPPPYFMLKMRGDDATTPLEIFSVDWVDNTDPNNADLNPDALLASQAMAFDWIFPPGVASKLIPIYTMMRPDVTGTVSATAVIVTHRTPPAPVFIQVWDWEAGQLYGPLVRAGVEMIDGPVQIGGWLYWVEVSNTFRASLYRVSTDLDPGTIELYGDTTPGVFFIPHLGGMWATGSHFVAIDNLNVNPTEAWVWAAKASPLDPPSTPTKVPYAQINGGPQINDHFVPEPGIPFSGSSFRIFGGQVQSKKASLISVGATVTETFLWNSDGFRPSVTVEYDGSGSTVFLGSEESGANPFRTYNVVDGNTGSSLIGYDSPGFNPVYVNGLGGFRYKLFPGPTGNPVTP